jgi:hypothetical protein
MCKIVFLLVHFYQITGEWNSHYNPKSLTIGRKILTVISKKKCNPYFIAIMITVLIMIGIFLGVNFKTTTQRLPQVIYVRLL